MPNFAEKVEHAVDALNSQPQKDVDENEFIEASRLVYDGVRDIRQAVLMSGVSIIFIWSTLNYVHLWLLPLKQTLFGV